MPNLAETNFDEIETSLVNKSGFSWLSYDHEVLERFWKESTSFGAVLRDKASAFETICTEEPNCFIVRFPSGAEGEWAYCEGEKSKIAERLSQKFGEKVALRCVIEPSHVPLLTDLTVFPDNYLSPANFSDDPIEDPNFPSKDIFFSTNSISTKLIKGQTYDSKLNRKLPNSSEVRSQLDNDDTVNELQLLFEVELCDIRQISVNNDDFIGYFF